MKGGMMLHQQYSKFSSITCSIIKENISINGGLVHFKVLFFGSHILTPVTTPIFKTSVMPFFVKENKFDRR